MRKIFTDTRVLDKKAGEAFLLPEEILMENAACALEQAVRDACARLPVLFRGVAVLIVAGSGGNGADGYTLARRLSGSTLADGRPLAVSVFSAAEPKTAVCRRQRDRASACGVPFLPDFSPADVVVDCLFGSGFRSPAPENLLACIAGMNAVKTPEGCSPYRIACDVPSGTGAGESAGAPVRFMADRTVCMGALKRCLFLDDAVDFTGEVSVADLGVSARQFESLGEPEAFLLEPGDLRLPVRTRKNVHKGTFGHSAVFCGGKPGAALMAAAAASAFGSGRTTLVFPEADAGSGTGRFAVPAELMTADRLPASCTAAAAGMGLRAAEGNPHPDAALDFAAESLAACPGLPAVLDADFFRWPGLAGLLRKRPAGLVLTPHPGEFASLLVLCGLAPDGISPAEVSARRFSFVRAFCTEFPGAVLLAKGAVPVTGFCPAPGQPVRLYANALGVPALAKGGSGDVLAGLVCALLAQGYPPPEAAWNASLAHTLAAREVYAPWGIPPQALIEAVRGLPLSAAKAAGKV